MKKSIDREALKLLSDINRLILENIYIEEYKGVNGRRSFGIFIDGENIKHYPLIKADSPKELYKALNLLDEFIHWRAPARAYDGWKM